MKAFWTSASIVAVVAAAAWYYRADLHDIPYVGQYLATTATAGASGSAASGQTADGGSGGQSDTSGSASSRAHDGGSARSGSGHGGRNGAPTPVNTIAAAIALLPMDVPATGWAEADESTTIAAQQQGLVVSIAATDGQLVKTGDLIARLDDRTASAAVAKDKANIASDQASLAEAQAALSRAQTLVKQSVQSQQTLDQAKAAADSATADLAAARATLAADQVALDNTEIRAPFDGRLGDIAVSVGAYLGAGGEIVSIAKYDPISVKFRLSERYLPQLRKAEKAGVPVDALSDTADGEPDTGTLRFVDNTVDTASGTILAKASFRNDDGRLWPGQSVNVTVHFAADARTIVVPTVAVRAGPDGNFIYTVDDQQKIHVAPVEVARSNGDRTAITSGISAGDHIIIEGQVQLSAGQTVVEHFDDGSGKPGQDGMKAKASAGSTKETGKS
ncbi:efflux RND transporter periplasmic adaptor subunit [Rhizobium halophytocola]|uniref:RND family efflux transporter MFP subunit n=1 Tax=Rhizobium halophytocola TaxID=735519 RepID=A0ABS4DYV2_9HYPH|nr:efflux RND transporter periplasmic adaptor subunit [Rhizobium halophytocola]MBP1850862.1 RND family efflux transporter MFP subunit [Rhizobium halophytocola]